MATIQTADEPSFSFLRVNERQRKLWTEGITEIRATYYPPMGRHCLEDILDTTGSYVDSLKVARGSFAMTVASCRLGNHQVVQGTRDPPIDRRFSRTGAHARQGRGEELYSRVYGTGI
jgi:hypothetical protein